MQRMKYFDWRGGYIISGKHWFRYYPLKQAVDRRRLSSGQEQRWVRDHSGKRPFFDIHHLITF